MMIMAAMAKPHVLVVDDDKAIVKVVRSYLEQAGFMVSTAPDGEHALHLRKKIEPDPANPTYIQTVYGVGYRMSKVDV